jgi:hypothetical protein
MTALNAFGDFFHLASGHGRWQTMSEASLNIPGFLILPTFWCHHANPRLIGGQQVALGIDHGNGGSQGIQHLGQNILAIWRDDDAGGKSFGMTVVAFLVVAWRSEAACQ